MIALDLQPIANQSFSVELDGSRYDLTFKECNLAMCVDVVRDEETIAQGVLLVAGSPVIPYPYMEAGNFVLLTENDELPYYPFFGGSQNLYYLSADEVAALRNA